MQNKQLEIFNFLHNHSHRVNEFAVSTLFPQMYNNHSNNTQYWLYSDLAQYFTEIHAYKNKKNISENLNLDMARMYVPKGFKKPDDNVKFSDMLYRHIEIFETNSSGHQNDAKITRLACAAITYMPETILAHLYFMMPNSDFNEIKNFSHDVSRIFRRQELAGVEKHINGILYSLKIKFELFSMITNQALFNERSANQLKLSHNIRINPSDPLSNYMQITSLKARIYSLEQTIKQYTAYSFMTADKFIDLARKNFENARMLMIKNYGHAPEQDLTPTHISRIQSRYNQLQREFIKTYKNESLR